MPTLYKFDNDTVLPKTGKVYAELKLSGNTTVMDSMIITNEAGKKLYGGKDMNGESVSEIEANSDGLDDININSGGSSSKEGEMDSSTQTNISSSVLETEKKQSNVEPMSSDVNEKNGTKNIKDYLKINLSFEKENRDEFVKMFNTISKMEASQFEDKEKEISAFLEEINERGNEAKNEQWNDIELYENGEYKGGKRRRGGRKSTKKPKSRRNASRRRRRRRSNKRRR